MPRLLVDYNRCFWYALMRVLELDIKGLANNLGVQRQTVHRWIEGRGRGPRRDSYLDVVALLTGGHAGRRGFEGAYDVLASETNKDRSTLLKWCKGRSNNGPARRSRAVDGQHKRPP